MIYCCEICNYKTQKHYNFLKHKNRKTPCCHKVLNEEGVYVETTNGSSCGSYPSDELSCVSSSDKNECSKCGKVFVSDRNLQRHLAVCKGSRYTCLVCNKTFGTRYGLYQHRKNVDCIHGTKTNNEVRYNAFGSENLDYLKKDNTFLDTMSNCVEKGVYGLIDLVGNIYMNPSHPENHTISKFREKGKELFVKTENNGWEFRHYGHEGSS